MSYKLIKNNPRGEPAQAIIRLEDDAFVPFDPDNIDYQKYLKWLDAGNTPEPADE